MYYFIRDLSNGTKLTTSYPALSTAKNQATKETTSTNVKLWEGDMFFNLETGAFGKEANGVGLISYIKAEGVSSDGGGVFAIFSKVNEKPNDLGIRFKNYGPANIFIKSMAPVYGELWVVQMEKIGKGKKDSEIEIELSQEAPF